MFLVYPREVNFAFFTQNSISINVELVLKNLKVFDLVLGRNLIKFDFTLGESDLTPSHFHIIGIDFSNQNI